MYPQAATCSQSSKKEVRMMTIHERADAMFCSRK